MKYRQVEKEQLLYIGLYIMFCIAITITLGSSLLLLDIPIGGWQLILGMIIATGILWGCLRGNNAIDRMKTVGYTIISVVVIGIILMGLCHYMKDFSYDGNMYHKIGVVSLAEGWNPYEESSILFNQRMENRPFSEYDSYSLWIDHYAKGPWIFAATLYKLTGSIEASKVLNILVIVAVICLMYHYLNKRYFNKWMSLFIAMALGFTPITIVQMFSYYVDGLLGSALYITILSLVMITDKQYNIEPRAKRLLLLSSIILMVNIKFTGLGLCAVFCGVFYLIWLFNGYREKCLKKTFLSWTTFFIISVVISVGIVGGSSYVQNTLEHKHPFYPLFGDEKVDIMTTNQPEVFAEMSGPHKLFIATFGESSNIYAAQKITPRLKVPFAIDLGELRSFSVPDTRIGGFGVWFSGILIISIIIIGIGLIRLFKANKQWFWILLSIVGTSILLLLILEESWWARYSPHMYLYPIIALILIGLESKKGRFKWLQSLMILIVSMNVLMVSGINIGSHMLKVINQQKVEKQLKVKSQKNNKKLKVYITDPNLGGCYYNLREVVNEYEIVNEFNEDFKPYYNGYLMYTIDGD